MVTENVRVAPDFQLPKPRQHFIVLACCEGDSPAQVKMSNSRSCTAYLACRYCQLTGVYIGGAVRLMGYAAPAEYGRMCHFCISLCV